MNTYRTIWISDLHLGTRGCQASGVLEFLRDTECDTMYLVGDLLDIWSLKRGLYWPQDHNDVIQKILRKARKGTNVIYIPGNHDEFIGSYHGTYGNIIIQKNAIHHTADGRRLLVIHGHELDTVVQNLSWLAHVGDIGYQVLIKLNGPINVLRKLFGFDYWSLSAYVKAEVKNVVSFIGKFEEAVVRYARDFHVDGVLCGHIHTAACREIDGIAYYNTGDWVESSTAIVEHHDGTLELLKFSHRPAAPAKAPTIARAELAGAV